MNLEINPERKAKYDKLLARGISPPYRYETTSRIEDVRRTYDNIKPEESTGVNVSVAGTVVAERTHGKLKFLDIEDRDSKIQTYFRADELGERYSDLENLDLGDIIGVKGEVVKTKRGELSVLVKDYNLLAKCLLPLPSLREPLSVEKKYRQRYLDLKTSKETRETFVKRARAISAMREHLDREGFIEVEIPLLQPVYGGAAAKPFTTHSNTLDSDLFLSISPELYLKRLIVGGMEKVYTITKNFRNEDIDTTHNPEFTMMECYQAYADLYDMMSLTENVASFIAQKVNEKTRVEYQGQTIDFTPPFKRLSMEEAVKQHTDFDIKDYSKEELKKFVEREQLEVKGEISYPNVVFSIFDKHVGDKLVQPTFIHDYPVDVSPLTRKHRTKPGWVERFELYVNKTEMANAYSELNDSFDQKERFERQQEMKKQLAEEAHPMDEDFVAALMYGLPPTGGLGIGIDRLNMILTDSPSIKDVILFPQMKTK